VVSEVDAGGGTDDSHELLVRVERWCEPLPTAARGKPSCLRSPSDALVLGRLAELVNTSVHERPQPRFQKNPSADCGKLRLIADDRLRHDGGVLTHSEQR
jgi:hypothetical protein